MIEDQARAALEAQIRECFGRVIYTHKTYSKMADRCARTLTCIKIGQIALSSITASGVIGTLFVDGFWLKVITAVFALLSVGVNAYMKGFDPGAAAQKHRETAAAIWPIRESYLSLLTDLVGDVVDGDAARKRRDDLQSKLALIYKGAPHTNGSAYLNAQKALKEQEEYTFSDEELDKFLPAPLKMVGRRSKGTSGSGAS